MKRSDFKPEFGGTTMNKQPLYTDPDTGEEHYALNANESLFLAIIVGLCIACHLLIALFFYDAYQKKKQTMPPIEKTVYIAGPITKVPYGNVTAFAEATRTVRNLGHIAKNPHELCHDIPKGSPWETYMRRCIPHLMECTDLILLPGWENSDGANLEYLNATHVGIVIHTTTAEFVARVEYERSILLENA